MSNQEETLFTILIDNAIKQKFDACKNDITATISRTMQNETAQILQNFDEINKMLDNLSRRQGSNFQTGSNYQPQFERSDNDEYGL